MEDSAVNGFPSKTLKLANFPASKDPINASFPIILAGISVKDSKICSTLKPISICFLIFFQNVAGAVIPSELKATVKPFSLSDLAL